MTHIRYKVCKDGSSLAAPFTAYILIDNMSGMQWWSARGGFPTKAQALAAAKQAAKDREALE